MQVCLLVLPCDLHIQVYWLGYGALKQVDLSDDMVVQAIAADDWENSMTLVQVKWQTNTALCCMQSSYCKT